MPSSVPAMQQIHPDPDSIDDVGPFPGEKGQSLTFRGSVDREGAMRQKRSLTKNKSHKLKQTMSNGANRPSEALSPTATEVPAAVPPFAPGDSVVAASSPSTHGTAASVPGARAASGGEAGLAAGAPTATETGHDDEDACGAPPAASPALAPEAPPASSSWLVIGRMVFVERRMGPGMNNPGGLGHIEKVYRAPGGEVRHVDVKYLTSEARKRDVGVPVASIEDRQHLWSRPRGPRRGARRCTRCGSFATDCDCDWVAAREESRRRKAEEAAAAREAEGRNEEEGSDGTSSDSDNGAGANSEEDERRAVRAAGRHRRRLGRITRSERDPDDIPLAVLKRRLERREARRRKAHRARMREARRAAREKARGWEAQMAELRGMMNGEKADPRALAAENERKEEKRKKRRKKSRTRPENACALGLLPRDVAGRSESDCDRQLGDASSDSEAGNKVNSEQQPLGKDQNESDKTVFTFDSDDVDPSEARRSKKQQDQDKDRFDNNNNHNINAACGENSDTSSDDDGLALSALMAKKAKNQNDKSAKQHPKASASRQDNQCKSGKLKNAEGSEIHSLNEPVGAEEQEDQSWATPREGYMTDNEIFSEGRAGTSSGEEEGAPTDTSESEISEDSDSSHSGVAAEGADTKSGVDAVPWANLPAFLHELSSDVECVRIKHTKNRLSVLKRRLRATRNHQMRPKDRSAELGRLVEERYVCSAMAMQLFSLTACLESCVAPQTSVILS